MQRIAVLAVILMLTLGLVANGALADNPVPKKAGICLDDISTDKGWNEQAKVGLQKAGKKWGFEVVVAERLGYGDIKPVLRDMAKKGCEFIYAHASGYVTMSLDFVKEGHGVKMVTDEGGKKALEAAPGMVSDLGIKCGPGGYAAGVLAGRMTRSNIVAVVSSAESNTACRLISGFVQGLKATNPNCKFIYNLIGQAAFGDAAGAKRNTEDAIAAGADVIFGHGDGASFGMLQGCSLKKAKDGGKAWFIDYIGDKTSMDKADVLLSSCVMDWSVVFDEIVQTIVDGTFGQAHYLQYPKSIYLIPPNKAVPQAVLDELDAVQKDIVAGKIQVVDIPLPSDMHAYMKETFPRK